VQLVKTPATFYDQVVADHACPTDEFEVFIFDWINVDMPCASEISPRGANGDVAVVIIPSAVCEAVRWSAISHRVSNAHLLDAKHLHYFHFP
jgi:hypothetical protein